MKNSVIGLSIAANFLSWLTHIQLSVTHDVIMHAADAFVVNQHHCLIGTLVTVSSLLLPRFNIHVYLCTIERGEFANRFDTCHYIFSLTSNLCNTESQNHPFFYLEDEKYVSYTNNACLN